MNNSLWLCRISRDFTTVLDLVPLLDACAPNIARGTMAAIVRHESGGRPFAIGLNHAEFRLRRQPRSAAEASAWASWLIERGYSVDLGLAQINSKNLSRLGLTVQTAFEPCANLRAASQLLTENYRAAVKKHGEGQEALRAALSAYNTGKMTGEVGMRYVLNLESVAVAQNTR